MQWRLPAALAVLASLLGGCFGSSPLATTTTTGQPPVPAGMAFSATVLVGEGGEPGLLITNGTLWAHAPGHMWRSPDGANWTAVNPGPALAIFGNDADMVQDKEGNVYYSDLQLTASLAVYVSGDEGASWSYQPLASMVPVVDRQWMASGPDAGPLAGTHSATYLVFNQLGSSPWITKSTDGGATWAGRLIDPTQTQATFWSMGNLVVDPRDGALFVVWTVGYAAEGIGPAPPVPHHIRFASSLDGGLTWDVRDAQSPQGNAGNLVAVLAQDAAGGLFLAWSEDMGDHQEVRLSSSGDRGHSWTAPVKVNAGNGTALMPWIAAGQPGHAFLAWYETNQTAPSSQVTGDWYVKGAWATDANSTTPTFRYVDISARPIRHGAICTLGIACTGDRDLLDFFQVRLDPSGHGHLVYASTEDGSGTHILYTRQVAGPSL